MSEAVIPIHPLAPKLHTFLPKVQEVPSISSLDFKAALKKNSLYLDSQYHCAFEWRDPDSLEVKGRTG